MQVEDSRSKLLLEDIDRVIAKHAEQLIQEKFQGKPSRHEAILSAMAVCHGVIMCALVCGVVFSTGESFDSSQLSEDARDLLQKALDKAVQSRN